MKITYDKEADAMYVELTEKKFSKCKKIDDNTILDLDKEGNVIGIELLFVSERLPNEFSTNIIIEGLTKVQA